MTRRWGAQELIDLVLDDGSFRSWDAPLDTSGHEPAYRAELDAAAARAGTDESVLTGRGLVRGRRGDRPLHRRPGDLDSPDRLDDPGPGMRGRGAGAAAGPPGAGGQQGVALPAAARGASVIRHGDVDHAVEMAAAQGVDAASLMRAGIVHLVVPEHVEDDRASLAGAVVGATSHTLVKLGGA